MIASAGIDASNMVQILIIEGWMAQIVGLLLIAALLSRPDYSTANRLLAFGLFCSVYRQAMVTLELSGILANFPILARTSFPVQMLGLPSFYLYVKALTTPNFRIERKHAVHLVPFIIGLALIAEPRLLQIAIKVIVVLPYLIQAHLQVRAFAVQERDFISDFSLLKLNWLRTLLIGVYSMLGVDALDVVTGPSVHVWVLIPSVGLIGLLALAYFSLRVSPVFASATLDRMSVLEQKKESSRLPDEQLDRQKGRLIEAFEKQAL
jgi:hypothetical protein